MDGESRSEEGGLGKIDLSGRNSAVDLSGQVHQLPCCIKYDGPCSVSHYFKPKSTDVEVDGLSVKEAHFRGRKLQGTTLILPQGYSGFIIGKKNREERKACDMSEEKANNWELNAKFRDITVWNHDSFPSQDDAFIRSFHWFAVSKASMATGTGGSCNSKEDPAWVYVIRDEKDKNKTTCKFCSKVMNGGIYRAK